MREYMYNINDERVEIMETENGAIVEYPDGHKKTFNSYDEADRECDRLKSAGFGTAVHCRAQKMSTH